MAMEYNGQHGMEVAMVLCPSNGFHCWVAVPPGTNVGMRDKEAYAV